MSKMQNNIVHTLIKEDYGLLDRPNRQNFWIGITDREVEGQFLYESSGTPLAFQYWGGSHHEPNGGPNENCLGYYSDWYQHGELNDLACSTITNFVCEKKFDADITCPEGWTLVGNKCLQLINEIRTYDEAVSHCISINGNLTEPRTDIEADQLRDFTNNKHVWIGINDKDQENKFIYESNGQEASFLRWSPNEPNNDPIDEDCVMTWTVDDGWNDKECDALLSFVCEISRGAKNQVSISVM